MVDLISCLFVLFFRDIVSYLYNMRLSVQI